MRPRGSYAKLGNAFGMLEKMRLGEVPSLNPVWRDFPLAPPSEKLLLAFEACKQCRTAMAATSIAATSWALEQGRFRKHRNALARRELLRLP